MEERWTQDREEAATVKKWWGRAVVDWGTEAALNQALKKGQAWELDDDSNLEFQPS